MLLLFLCPHTIEQGPGNTNPGGNQGSLLEEPFTAARFTNRNIMILQNDRVITIYIQNYKTSKYAGSDTVSIQVSWNKDIKRTEISQCYECLFTDSIFHPLLSNLKKSTSLRERAQMKQSWKKSLTPEKKKIEFADNLLNGHSLSAGRQWTLQVLLAVCARIKIRTQRWRNA